MLVVTRNWPNSSQYYRESSQGSRSAMERRSLERLTSESASPQFSEERVKMAIQQNAMFPAVKDSVEKLQVFAKKELMVSQPGQERTSSEKFKASSPRGHVQTAVSHASGGVLSTQSAQDWSVFSGLNSLLQNTADVLHSQYMDMKEIFKQCNQAVCQDKNRIEERFADLTAEIEIDEKEEPPVSSPSRQAVPSERGSSRRSVASMPYPVIRTRASVSSSSTTSSVRSHRFPQDGEVFAGAEGRIHAHARRISKSKKFAPHITALLRAWLTAHLTNPYPSEHEKAELLAQTGITLMQLNDWFINARRRLLNQLLAEHNKESPSDETAMGSEDVVSGSGFKPSLQSQGLPTTHVPVNFQQSFPTTRHHQQEGLQGVICALTPPRLSLQPAMHGNVVMRHCTTVSDVYNQTNQPFSNTGTAALYSGSAASHLQKSHYSQSQLQQSHYSHLQPIQTGPFAQVPNPVMVPQLLLQQPSAAIAPYPVLPQQHQSIVIAPGAMPTGPLPQPVLGDGAVFLPVTCTVPTCTTLLGSMPSASVLPPSPSATQRGSTAHIPRPPKGYITHQRHPR